MRNGDKLSAIVIFAFSNPQKDSAGRGIFLKLKGADSEFRMYSPERQPSVFEDAEEMTLALL